MHCFARGPGETNIFVKKINIFLIYSILYIIILYLLPVLTSKFGSIWILHSENVNIFIRAFHLNLSFRSS